MTVRSKQFASQLATTANSAKVVALPSPRLPSAGKYARMNSPARQRTITAGKGAELLSIRQHLTYIATIGLNDIEFIETSYSPQVAGKLSASVRELLDQEFGPLRVYRRRQAFVVSHHSRESLYAGLFRVQFHSSQIPLPSTRDGNGPSDRCGIPLSWGVGKSMIEAEAERHSRK